jgi:hypothetical protein
VEYLPKPRRVGARRDGIETEKVKDGPRDSHPSLLDVANNCGKLLPSHADGAPVAQLDRASGYEPEGREFESPRAHHLLPCFSSIFSVAKPPIVSTLDTPPI